MERKLCWQAVVPAIMPMLCIFCCTAAAGRGDAQEASSGCEEYLTSPLCLQVQKHDLRPAGPGCVIVHEGDVHLVSKER